jgi:YVTN family beta-propeller protein
VVALAATADRGLGGDAGRVAVRVSGLLDFTCVADAGNRVSVTNPATDTFTTTITVGNQPFGVAVGD